MSYINREKVLGEITDQLRLFKGEENLPENKQAINQVIACQSIVAETPEPESVAVRIKDYKSNFCKCGACKKRVITPLVLDLENGETVFCPKCGVKLKGVVSDDEFYKEVEAGSRVPLVYDDYKGENIYDAEEAGVIIKRHKEGAV